MRLLLVSLPEPLRSGLLAAADRSGFGAITCDVDGAEGSFCLNHRAVVLLNLSATGAADVAGTLRRDHPVMLMVGLASGASVEERLSWLEVVDRCLPLGEDPWVALAEVRALLRRCDGGRSRKRRGADLTSIADLRRSVMTPLHSTSLSVGPVSFDADVLVGGVERFSAVVGGEVVALTGLEGEILLMLMQGVGSVVTKADVFARIYAGRAISHKIVDVVVCKVRRKLAAAGAPRSFIRTIWGRGYTIEGLVAEPAGSLAA